MRVTGGALRGRHLLAAPPGVRPSADRIREALFARLGDLHFARDDYPAARDELLEATRIWPHNISAFFTLSLVYRRLGEDALAEQAARKGSVRIEFSGLNFEVRLAKQAARVIALMDGRPLGDIAKQARLDWLAFSQAWGPVHRELTGVNLLRYSRKLT